MTCPWVKQRRPRHDGHPHKLLSVQVVVIFLFIIIIIFFFKFKILVMYLDAQRNQSRRHLHPKLRESETREGLTIASENALLSIY